MHHHVEYTSTFTCSKEFGTLFRAFFFMFYMMKLIMSL